MDTRALLEAVVTTAITPLGSLALVAVGLMLVVVLVKRVYRP